MGTWGAENFADDVALDWLGNFSDELVAQIRAGMRHDELICGHLVMAQIEVFALLCENLNVIPLEPGEVALWRDAVLETWDANIDGYEPKPEYKTERRSIIEATFARLAAVAEKYHQE